MGEGIKKTRAKTHRQTIDKAGATGVYETNLFSGMPVAEAVFVECEFFAGSDVPSEGDRVNLIDRGKSHVEVYRGTSKIGQVTEAGSQLLRDEMQITSEPGSRISGIVKDVMATWLQFTVGIYLKS